jgi:hypothetical protein
MALAPQNDRCSAFADYVLENYISSEANFHEYCGLKNLRTDVAQPMDMNHSIVILTNNFIHRILQFLIP